MATASIALQSQYIILCPKTFNQGDGKLWKTLVNVTEMAVRADVGRS